MPAARCIQRRRLQRSRRTAAEQETQIFYVVRALRKSANVLRRAAKSRGTRLFLSRTARNNVEVIIYHNNNNCNTRSRINRDDVVRIRFSNSILPFSFQETRVSYIPAKKYVSCLLYYYIVLRCAAVNVRITTYFVNTFFL